jgi:hypothetical protein
VALIEAYLNSLFSRDVPRYYFYRAIDVVFIVSYGGLMDSVPDKNTSLLSVLRLANREQRTNKDLSDLHYLSTCE